MVSLIYILSTRGFNFNALPTYRYKKNRRKFTHMWFHSFTYYVPVVSILTLCPPTVTKRIRESLPTCGFTPVTKISPTVNTKQNKNKRDKKISRLSYSLTHDKPIASPESHMEDQRFRTSTEALLE